MKKTKKILALLLCAAFLIGALAGCGGGANDKQNNSPANNGAKDEAATSGGTDKPAEKVDLKISHHPYAHALPGIYAAENGMYDDYFNYTIDIYSNGPVQNEAIASGAWEVGTTGLGGVVLGIINYDMKVLGFTTPDTKTTDIWVRPDSPLASAAADADGVVGTADDWRGLTVLCNRGTICHMVLLGTLEHLGLTESDINIVDASVANCYTAFLAGEADVVCLWDALGAKAVENNWVKVSCAEALGIELPAVIVATDAAVKEKPEAVRQWLEIYLEASDILASDPDTAAAELYDFQTSEGISVTEEDCAVIVVDRPFLPLEQQAAMFTPDDSGEAPAREILLKYADFMLSQGNIEQADYDRMANSDFIHDDMMDIAAAK